MRCRLFGISTLRARSTISAGYLVWMASIWLAMRMWRQERARGPNYAQRAWGGHSSLVRAARCITDSGRPGCKHHAQKQVRHLSQGLASSPLAQGGVGQDARRRGEKGMNKTTLLIGGLGLGAGLVYMLDPERGERRRT